MEATPRIVSDAEIERFYEDGYLVIEDAFEADEINAMRREADFILELILNSSIANDRKSGRLDLVQADDGTQQVRKIQPVNDLSLGLARVATDDRLLQPMREVMAEEPILMEEKLNYKQPLPEPISGLEGDRPTSGFPVHNDWAYYKDNGYPQSIISSAIAIDDCTPENGPMTVWPGTHTEHVPHESGPNGYEVPVNEVDEEGGVEVLAPAGSVMFFHSLLHHSSTPNESEEPRRLMIYSHYPEEEGAAAGMAFDQRNGPTRLRESPWELEYLRNLQAGAVESPFSAP